MGPSRRGLTQRITALNLFLRDIYNEGRILADGVVPREMVYSCKHFRRQMRGVTGAKNIYVAVVGTDLIRLPDRRIRRARRQSARAERRVLHAHLARSDEAHLPGVPRYGVRPIEHYPQALLATLTLARARGPPRAGHRAAHAGRLQLAYFEHTYLARQMGIELVEGRDLVIHDNVVYMRTTAGLRAST